MKINKRVLLQVLATLVTTSATRLRCKCTPEDACWPTSSDWAHLNTTLSGALILPTPPASVCFASQPNYDEEACALIRSKWFDSTFHASDPISIDYPIWTNNSCNPIFPNGTSLTGDPNAGKRGCNADTYPAYVVNAIHASQIATSLKWAGEKNVRVVVKATGHSYTGRSTGPGSLSIWTHNIRGIEYIEEFLATSCPVSAPIAAVRVAAGHTNGELQEFLSKYGRVIVSGANPSVGIIGWLTGGGHGFLSSTYGMGSDNLLEATVVLPSGAIVVANPCQNSDIFFAIRGGGGGTFGVVTEVVLKTHPSPQTTMHIFTLASLPNTMDVQFWDATGYLHAHMQRLKEGGMQGYYYIVGPPTSPSLSLIWMFMLFDKPDGTVESLMAPAEKYLMERANLFTYTSNITHTASYFDIAQHVQNEAVANGGSTYGSRLLSPGSLADAVVNAEGPVSNPTLIGHMIAAPAIPSYYPSLSSLNPAWRNTLVHLVVVEVWQDGSPQATIDAVRGDITIKTQKLRALSPDTGAYFNEADSNELDWQKSFFGKNYDRLKKIKRDIDPENILWCRKCVGSEAFVERNGGRLCSVRSEDGDNSDGMEEVEGKKSELRP
ncbi:FAD binding domain protein [Macroventuria anomochaeta]|uniref:FAD binding domain protein n=1 Tax=Macroventuria anomochaeta TaxID=301207 RepID=A0ACB6RRU8_9PLEO|nr:FAD binding domain protein [Macroventuria anomochaeta]KAF2624631.1 FAD binding domain protein [Macroventuria anomochaeta]